MRKRAPALLLAVTLAPAALAAQDPVGDSVAVARTDTTRAAALPDSAAADTLSTFHNLPEFADGVTPGWATGIWVWDQEEILASGANTLVELFDDVPGVVPLLAGDYGTPAAFTAFGVGSGGVRLFRDGFELLPMAGGLVDLQRVGLAGIGRVRLRRSGGQVRVELWSLDYDDVRPYSLIEAGTGDLDNNLFRGVFTAPNVLGGSLGLGLERQDTRGAASGQTGSRTGTWVRYQLHAGDGAGVALDYRSMGSKSEIASFPAPVRRSDVVVRARARLAEGVVAELHTGRTSYVVEDGRELYATEGGSRTQHAVRLSLDRAGFWGVGAFRLYRGDDLLENRLDLEGGWTRPGVAGVTGRFSREDWVGARPSSRSIEGWLSPLPVLTLFGAWDAGRHGGRSGPVFDRTPPEPDPGDPTDPEWMGRPVPVLWTTERSTYRAGAALSWRDATLSAATLGIEQDVALPLGLAPDFGATPMPAATRRGWEVYGRIPGPMDGLSLVGSYQEWDRPGPYLPGRIYRGALDFHRTFMPTGNLELWASLGVRGHDAMEVFVPPEADSSGSGTVTVPFFQSWDARVQVRIVTVRIFVTWENASVRRNLQTFPGRILPPLRTSYGIRWTMWN